MSSSALACAMTIGLLGFAAADGACAQDRNPDWLKKPSSETIRAAAPYKAAKEGRSGGATLRCIVNIKGLLEGCVVVSETAPDYGYGEAALLLSPSFVMRPALKNGKPVPARVTVPVRFELAPSLTIAGKSDLVASTLRWLETPTPQQVADAYPKGQEPGPGPALVVLNCRVAAEGRLSGCGPTVQSRMGFRSAAIDVSRHFRADVSKFDAETLRRLHVNLPIAFLGPDYATRERTLTKAPWTRQIDPEKVQALFPAKAADAGLTEGRAVVSCTVARGGDLTGCQATEETPAGVNFGPTAAHIASSLAVAPWTETGEPTEGAHVKFAIRFKRAEPAPAAPAAN